MVVILLRMALELKLGMFSFFDRMNRICWMFF